MIRFNTGVTRHGSNFITSVCLPTIPEEWNVGVIIGPSGSGKTTILRKLFGVSDDEEVKGIPSNLVSEDLLLSVGLRSLPSWYTNASYLSGGETERLSVALKLDANKTMIVLDEFTSLVDRSTALGMARGVANWCRLNNRKLVVATIHKDIIPYMNPSWTWSTRQNDFIPTSLPWELPLHYKKGSRSDWSMFSKYHYIDNDISNCATITLAYVDTDLVGIISFIGHIGGGKRVHRLVVFPEWQGLGLGTRILNERCEHVQRNGLNVYIKTSHPAMGKFLEKSPLWEPTGHNRKTRSDKGFWNAISNACWCYKKKPLDDITDEIDNDILYPECLTYVGKISSTHNKYKYKSRHQGVKYFVTEEDALSEQRRHSIERGCQPYTIKENDVTIMISREQSFQVDSRDLDILRGYKWYIRNQRVFRNSNGQRIYLQCPSKVLRNL